jgi:flagellar protein FliO/FliZ
MDMLGLVVRLICSLAVVLGLLLLIARFAGRRFQGRTGAPVQVLHRQPISRGSSVTVVSVGTRILVLGSTEHQITLLTELEPDEIELDLTVPATVSTDVSEAMPTPVPEATPQAVPRAARHRSDTPASGPLAGSLLSGQTWRQALAAATRAPGAGATLAPPTVPEKRAS